MSRALVVAVLYGGISAEREVSLSSGRQVIVALREAGYAVRPIEVSDDLPGLIAALTPKPDAVFNALHGRFGEDGAIQGVLDWLAIPYTHSGVRASALAMDKEAAKAIFAAAGLPVAPGRVIDIAALAASDPLARPYVIKPLNEGSSVGVHILREGDNRRAEIAHAWTFGPTAMAEEYIPGRELTVAVMENRALAVTEIVASQAFYDYASKYADGIVKRGESFFYRPGLSPEMLPGADEGRRHGRTENHDVDGAQVMGDRAQPQHVPQGDLESSRLGRRRRARGVRVGRKLGRQHRALGEAVRRRESEDRQD